MAVLRQMAAIRAAESRERRRASSSSFGLRPRSRGGRGVTRSAMQWISPGKNTVSREVQSHDARTRVECSRAAKASGFSQS